jgi:glycerol-3-phosphate acyltransferase PlsX
MSPGRTATVALDAMGGDHAPEATVLGAVEAVREHGVKVLLVGQEPVLRNELSRLGSDSRGIEIVHAPDVVEMSDHSTAAVRGKQLSSLAVATRLVRDGAACAMVTAGNTGAAMVSAKLTLGTIEGVDRPALATLVPGIDHQTLLLDVGANVDCKPRHLVEFAVMGQSYSEAVLGVTRPRVGLLSIGEEDGKGDRLTSEAFALLSRLDLNFIGNVEGRDVFSGRADVIVCDGFVGNVVLKVSEGLGEMVFALLKREARRSPLYSAGFLIAKGAFAGFKRQVDYAEYGGAPLLGVKGACLVGHGRSNPKAVRNALRFAHAYATRGVIEHIASRLGKLYPQHDHRGV